MKAKYRKRIVWALLLAICTSCIINDDLICVQAVGASDTGMLYNGEVASPSTTDDHTEEVLKDNLAYTESEEGSVDSMLKHYASTYTYLGDSDQKYVGYVEWRKGQWLVYSCKDSVPAGPVSYRIDDFDLDGQNELLIVTMDQDYNTILEIYEVEENAVVKRDSSRLGTDGYIQVKTGLGYEDSSFNCMVYSQNGKKIIAIEEYSKAFISADGIGIGFITFEYRNGKLDQNDCILEQGSSWDQEDEKRVKSYLEKMGVTVNASDLLNGNSIVSDYITEKIIFASVKTQPRSYDFDYYKDVTDRKDCSDITFTKKNTEMEPINSTFDLTIYKASDIYDFYKGNSGGMNGSFKNDTPCATLYKEDSKLVNSVKAWKELEKLMESADDPSGVLDRNFEKRDLYEGIVLSLFEEAGEDHTFKVKDALETADSLLGTITTNMNAVYGIQVGENYDITSLTQEQRETIRNVSQDYFKKKGIVKTEKVLSNISKSVDYLTTLQELCKYQSSCMAIMEMSESYKNVLQYMYEHCPYDNPDLKLALKDCVTIMKSSQLELSDKMRRRLVTIVGKEAVKYGIDKIWDIAKESVYASNPYVALYWAAYKSASFLCDTLFNTSEIAERTVKMGALLEIRKLLQEAYDSQGGVFEKDRSKGNAETYLAAIDMNYRYLDEDCSAAYKFVEAVDGALLNKLLSLFGKKEHQEVKRKIEDMRKGYQNEFYFMQMLWINDLEAEYPEQYARYKSILEESSENARKKYWIACPVDVYVYDTEGNLAVSVVNNIPFCADESLFTVASSDGEKEIWFYGEDGDYTIRYSGTDQGTMDITVEEYDEKGEISRQTKHTDVPLKKDSVYTSQEHMAQEQNDYVLTEEGGGNKRNPVMDTADKNMSQYTLSVKNGYMVNGTDSGYTAKYYAGEKVTVYANIPENAEWKGWESDAGENIFNDKHAKSVTITMPERDVNLTASYEIEERGQQILGGQTFYEKNVGDQAFWLDIALEQGDGEITYASGDTSVVQVNDEGMVTITGAGKTAINVIVKGTHNYYPATEKIIIEVKKPEIKVKSLSMKAEKIVKKDTSAVLRAKIRPANADNKTLQWTSSDESVVMVTENGTLLARKNGTAVITVKAMDGSGKEAACKVTVPYNINYKFQKGMGSCRNPCFYYNQKVDLEAPSRPGYIFAGWYTDSKYKHKITTIKKGSEKDYTLYAKWKKLSVKKPELISVTGRRKGEMTVRYKKAAGAKGYQIYYSTDRKFKKCRKKTTSAKGMCRIKKLKTGRVYYVCMRAYKIDSAGKKVYSKYTAYKKYVAG